MYKDVSMSTSWKGRQQLDEIASIALIDPQHPRSDHYKHTPINLEPLCHTYVHPKRYPSNKTNTKSHYRAGFYLHTQLANLTTMQFANGRDYIYANQSNVACH